MIATHNQQSIEHAVSSMQSLGIATHNPSKISYVLVREIHQILQVPSVPFAIESKTPSRSSLAHPAQPICSQYVISQWLFFAVSASLLCTEPKCELTFCCRQIRPRSPVIFCWTSQEYVCMQVLVYTLHSCWAWQTISPILWVRMATMHTRCVHLERCLFAPISSSGGQWRTVIPLAAVVRRSICCAPPFLIGCGLPGLGPVQGPMPSRSSHDSAQMARGFACKLLYLCKA